MRAVLYLRAGTAEQVQSHSFETRQQACVDYCEREGIGVVRTFRDEGESAKTANRQRIQEMLDYCGVKANRIDLAVVCRVDRHGRRVHDHHLIRTALAKLGIQVLGAHGESPARRLVQDECLARGRVEPGRPEPDEADVLR